MSLPNDITATDSTTNTSSFWNDLVENYESIFDGSAFDDESVTTKYGTVARYVELDSGNPTDDVILEVSMPYLVIIKDEPGTGLDTQLGLFTNGVQSVGITEGNYGDSYVKTTAKVIVPTNTSFVASVQNGGPTSDTVTKFIIIKLNNNPDSWANNPALITPGMTFAPNEILTGQKVNRLIANVNTEAVGKQTVDSGVLDIQNNTKNSMSLIGNITVDEIEAPAYEASIVVAELPIVIENNLEDSLLLITGVAETKDVLGELVSCVAVGLYDPTDSLVVEQTGERLDWFNLQVPPQDAGSYTVKVSYYNGSLNVDEGDPLSVSLNITVLGFGA